ncbi:MAG: hypothetical protein KDI15_11245 [Thiothrix sp.]|nr:hypothetical protein [Thiothrix sp.]HPE61987.1 hypothetical protein [Thiolinea sp.]
MHSDSLLKALPLILLTGAAQADARLAFTDSGFGPQSRQTEILIQDGKVRMGEAGAPVYSLFDSKTASLLTINPQARQYIDNSPEKMAGRARQMKTMQERMKAAFGQQLTRLPPEQRSVMEARMKLADEQMQAPAPHVEYRNNNTSTQVSGFACQLWTVYYNQTPNREICNAGPETLAPADFDTLLAMFGYMDKLASESAAIQGVTAPPEGMTQPHRHGLAVRIRALPQGPSSELTALSREALDTALFTLPDGFSELEPATATPPATDTPPAPATDTGTPARPDQPATTP